MKEPVNIYLFSLRTEAQREEKRRKERGEGKKGDTKEEDRREGRRKTSLFKLFNFIAAFSVHIMGWN